MARLRILLIYLLLFCFLIGGCSRPKQSDQGAITHDTSANSLYSRSGSPTANVDAIPPFGKFGTKTYGPFQVGVSTFHSISVEILSALLSDSLDGDPWTDVSLIVKSQNGETIYRRNEAAHPQVHRQYVLAPVQVNESIRLLLVMSEVEPTAPGSGVDGQYYTVNDDGLFVSVTGKISPSGNGATPQLFPILQKDIDGSSRLVVEAGYWTGNFTVLFDYPIHLEGTWEQWAQSRGLPEYPVDIDEKVASSQRRIMDADTAISLYPTHSNEPMKPKIVPINMHTKIEFLGAVRSPTVDVDWWLHVRINGQEGFVTGFRDLSIIGLPAAD
jgi:hypothetical protein